eukprot:6188328-Pleurochrysis_carterae.AAC.1
MARCSTARKLLNACEGQLVALCPLYSLLHECTTMTKSNRRFDEFKLFLSTCEQRLKRASGSLQSGRAIQVEQHSSPCFAPPPLHPTNILKTTRTTCDRCPLWPA